MNVNNEKSNSKLGLIIASIILVFVIAAAGYYIYLSQQYSNTFLPGTLINGISAEGRTVEDVEAEMTSACSDFSITVKARGREDEYIKSSDIDLHYSTDDAIEEVFNQQNKYTWLIKKFSPDEFRISTSTVMDDNKFNEVASSLKCFDTESSVKPTAAHISEYNPDGGYTVIHGTTGNYLSNQESAKNELKNAILTLEPEFDMENGEGHLYDIPILIEDVSDVQNLCDKANSLTRVYVSYTGSDIILDGQTVSRMLTFTKDDVKLNENLLNAFVRILSDTYDTYEKNHTFKSTWGDDVTVEGGSFGWLVDRETEYQHIVENITNGDVLEREPDFSKRGITFGKYDYGDTYVEVNLTAQHMYYYKEGKLILHSNVVTGRDTNDRRTPQGEYAIFSKQTDRVLRGAMLPDGTYEYESHVNYWMPFNKGIGLHDATWRSSFGGNIWKYSGSHGCVNLPLKTAKSLYGNIETGCPVICYFLEGSSGEAPNAPEIWTEPGTVSETTTAKITRAETSAATTTAAVTESVTAAETVPAETTPVAETTENFTYVEYGPGGMTPPAEEQ